MKSKTQAERMHFKVFGCGCTRTTFCDAYRFLFGCELKLIKNECCACQLPTIPGPGIVSIINCIIYLYCLDFNSFWFGFSSSPIFIDMKTDWSEWFWWQREKFLVFVLSLQMKQEEIIFVVWIVSIRLPFHISSCIYDWVHGINENQAFSMIISHCLGCMYASVCTGSSLLSFTHTHLVRTQMHTQQELRREKKKALMTCEMRPNESGRWNKSTKNEEK